MLAGIERTLANRVFQNTIIFVILLNAAILGVMTKRDLDPGVLSLLEFLDNACLVVFCVEIAMKLAVMRLRFFRDGWNVFDFAVVAIALAPASGPLAVLRAMRVFRLMRLVTAVPSMRRVVSGMFGSIPGVASVAGVLFVLYYVAAIMATSFFHTVDGENFGDLGSTFFTLFQLMTLEGWPDIALTIMDEMPMAWAFFVPFIVMTTFTTLNLMFGIVVNAMEEAKEEEARAELAEKGMDVEPESNEVRLAVIENDVKGMAGELERLQAALSRMCPAKTIAGE
ncbi:MAG: ion transporter [Alphaproteobacteria bacterium]|nr:ion transporter [Alphaproteobacteria bacterium]